MKNGSLMEDVLIAGGLTAACIPLGLGLGIIALPSLAFRLLIATLTVLFVLSLMRRTTARTGRVTILFALLLSFGLGTAGLGIAGYCLMAAMLIWAIRSALSYSSVAMVGLDLMLTLTSLSAAWGMYGTTSSFLAAVWTFFLLQGFARLIPRRIRAAEVAPRQPTVHEDPFDRAYASAEAALKRVITKTA